MSLRLRITLAFAAAMAAVLLALSAFVYTRTGSALLDEVDAGLRSRAEVLAAQVRASGPRIPQVPPSLIESDEAFAQIADGGGRILESSRIIAAAPLLDPATSSSVTRARIFDRRIPPIDNVTRVLAVPVRYGGGTYVLMVGASLQDRRDVLLQLGATLAAGGILALVVISLGGWLLVGAALRPVEHIRQEAEAISSLEPDRRLPVPAGEDELAALAATLNSMLDRLEASFERERRFVDDASHEIRTPLGVLRSRLELALARPRSSQELGSALRRSLADVEGLSRLADDLLVLARADRGRVPIHREDVRLDQLVEEAVAPYRERAGEHGVEIEVSTADVSASVDPVRVRQALGNLLDNAIRHAPAGGSVRVEADRVDGEVRLDVEDDGDGFPAALLPDVFEPFRRGDDEGNEPGAGLGLAIVHAIAQAHGGSASAENRPEGGARVTVTLHG